jgi:hypothetical protein
MEKTLGSSLSSAELCRRNGWAGGWVLCADDPPAALRLTAVGDRRVLAIDLHNEDAGEVEWDLTQRLWRTPNPPLMWTIEQLLDLAAARLPKGQTVMIDASHAKVLVNVFDADWAQTFSRETDGAYVEPLKLALRHAGVEVA